MDENKPISSDQEIADTSMESQLNNMPKSQALLDIEANEAEMNGPEGQKGSAAKSAPQNLAVIARFRWVLLFVLSLAAIIFWAAEAQISDRPYKLPALGYLAASLLLTVPTMKFFRIPTRGGLAALLWAGTFFMSAWLESPGAGERLFGGQIPAALPWGGLLVMILLWQAVAVWRKVGRYRVIDIILSVFIVYAALSPLLALISGIASGDVLSMNFQALNNSPFFITNNLPWFLWPLTVLLALLLPLGALFALWDQVSVLKRRGARHGGNTFLALAFLLLIPYGFVHYDQAVAGQPELAALLINEPVTTVAPPTASIEPFNEAPPIPAAEEPVAPPLEEPLKPTEPPQISAPLPPTSELPPAASQESPSILENLPEPGEGRPTAPSSSAPLPAAPLDKVMELENELNAAKNRIDTLESRLEALSQEIEQLTSGSPSRIPAPPAEPPVRQRLREHPGFSSAT